MTAPDGCDLCGGAHSNEEHDKIRLGRLRALVASMDIDAFAAWIQTRAELERKGHRRVVFHSADDCRCPLARFLRASAGDDVSEEICVSDDSASDGVQWLGNLPAWAARFVRDFDETFASQQVAALELVAWLNTKRKKLEALPHED